MIKLENATPKVYYEMSRDFQFIGRLYDLVLNSCKTDIDLIRALPNGANANEVLLNLLADTLGFKATKNYNTAQLLAICNALPIILRNKGNLNSLFIAVNALLRAEEIQDTLDYSFADNVLTLFIPEQLSDITIIFDLLDYVIPAGISVKVIRELKEVVPITTAFYLNDKVNVFVLNQQATIWNGTDKINDVAVKNNNYVFVNTGVNISSEKTTTTTGTTTGTNTTPSTDTTQTTETEEETSDGN